MDSKKLKMAINLRLTSLFCNKVYQGVVTTPCELENSEAPDTSNWYHSIAMGLLFT